jgi:hypothetical protein
VNDGQSIDELMKAIGPSLQLGEVRAYPDQAAWALVFDEDRIILAEHDRDEVRLWLSSEVAPAVRRLELFERLMTFNGLWRETAGYRLALDGPGRNFLLACDVRADALTLDGFRIVLGNFVDTLAAWRRIVAPGAENIEPEPHAAYGAIRG